jgi:hypothetical protein
MKRGPKPKTHCKHGHAMESDNLLIYFDKKHQRDARRCLACSRRRALLGMRRRRAA